MKALTEDLRCRSATDGIQVIADELMAVAPAPVGAWARCGLEGAGVPLYR